MEMESWAPGPASNVTWKRNFAISVALGIAGGLVAYALAWGLFTTHQELGMDSKSAITIAAWAAPIIFVVSLIYLSARSAGRR